MSRPTGNEAFDAALQSLEESIDRTHDQWVLCIRECDSLRTINAELLAALSSIEARLSALKFAGVTLDNDGQCMLHEARTAIKKAREAK